MAQMRKHSAAAWAEYRPDEPIPSGLLNLGAVRVDPFDFARRPQGKRWKKRSVWS
jgi:hypothetical protein